MCPQWLAVVGTSPLSDKIAPLIPPFSAHIYFKSPVCCSPQNMSTSLIHTYIHTYIYCYTLTVPSVTTTVDSLGMKASSSTPKSDWGAGGEKATNLS